MKKFIKPGGHTTSYKLYRYFLDNVYGNIEKYEVPTILNDINKQFHIIPKNTFNLEKTINCISVDLTNDIETIHSYIFSKEFYVEMAFREYKMNLSFYWRHSKESNVFGVIFYINSTQQMCQIMNRRNKKSNVYKLFSLNESVYMTLDSINKEMMLLRDHE